MKVYKFGGASVKDADGIRNVVSIIRNESEEDLVIVVSAMGKMTNALERLVELSLAGEQELMSQVLSEIVSYHKNIIVNLSPIDHTSIENDIDELFKQISSSCNAAILNKPDYDEFYDSIVSFGELISSRILSYILGREGIENTYIDITDFLITDNTFREAVPDISMSGRVLTEYIKQHPHRVYVTQGFIGGTECGKHTTLGREGSDYSAALIANMLQAESVTIWKDVPGVLNADPRLVDDTCLIDELSYSDAVELAYSGAQIIHPKTIRPLQNKNIPLYVRPFSNPEQSGTVIHEKTNNPINVPVIIWRKNQVLITLRAKDFSFALEVGLNRLFETIYRNKLKVSLIQSSAITISVCVDKSRYLRQTLQELSDEYRISYNDGLSLLTIRGTTPEIIERYTKNKTILLSQTTRRTARFVIQECVS